MKLRSIISIIGGVAMSQVVKIFILVVLGTSAFVLITPAQTVLAADEIVITSPTNEQYFSACSDIQIVVDPQIDDAQVKDILVTANVLSVKKFTKSPWEFAWKNVPTGYYTLKAKMTDKNGTVYDSKPVYILVGAAVRGEILINSGFDCRVYPWYWQMNQGATGTFQMFTDGYFNDDSYAMLTVDNPGSADWHLQLGQICPIDSGHTYEISFLADAEKEKAMSVMIQINHDPYSVYWNQAVTITQWGLYGPFEFVSDTTDYTCKFIFNVAGNDIDMMLDEVRVIDLNHTDVESRESGTAVVDAFKLEQNYPNPFNMNTNIHYSVAQKGQIQMAIYNLSGQKICSLVDMVQNAGSYSVQWNGTDEIGRIAPSGVYFYRMTASTADGKETMSKKLLLVK
jgi:hypothetical protein